MKKIICLFLTLSVIFSVPIVATADEVERGAVINSLDMLQALGIVQEEYNPNNINVEQKITRAEFAVYFTKLMNIEPVSSENLYYNDVPQTHYAYKEITVLTEMGYLSGISKKKFNPDEVISKEHAMIVMLKALGYSDLMSYGANGLKMAIKNTDINKNVSGNGELVFGDLIVMMKNALLAECLDIGGISSGGNLYGEGRSLLHYTRNMEYVKNCLMSAANGASLYGEKISGDEVIVGNERYVTGLGNVTEYLGCKVDLIYYQGDDAREKEIIWIEKSLISDELRISIDEDAEFDRKTSTLYYYEGNSNRQKSVKIPQGISIVYNGSFVAEGIADIFSADKYELTLVRLESKDEYDAAVIWAYENCFVSGVDTEEMLIYDKITKSPISLNENDYTYFEITNIAGEKLSIKDITPKSVVSTYLSKDKSFLKAVVTTESVSGKYTGHNSKGEILLDGNGYMFYDTEEKQDFTGVKKLLLYLDHKGYIAYAETSYADDNMFVGYTFKGSFKEDGFSKAILLKLLCEDGEIKEYSITDSLNIDGKKYNNLKEAYEKLEKDEKGHVKPQIMCFTTNKAGEITRIDLSDDNGGSGKVIMKNKVQPTEGIVDFKDTMNIIGMNMLVNNGTKIFYVPVDADVENADESDFGIAVPVDAQDFNDAVSYKITPEEVFYEQYIVRKGALTATSFSDYEGFFLVEDVIEILDKSGERVPAIVGMQMGQKYTLEIDEDVFDFFADSTLKNVKSGDILRVAHKNNVLGNARLIYSYGQETPVAENRDDPVHHARFISGYAHSKEGDVFKLDFEGDGAWEQIADMTNYSKNIMVYDSESRGEKVYKGNVSDMKTAVDAGKGSFIVMHTYYMRCWGLVIYK